MATGGRTFDFGLGQYGDIGTTALLEVTTGAVGGWISNLNEGVSGALFGCNNSGSFAGFIYAWESGGFDQRFTFFDGTTWQFSNSIGAATALAAGWHHIMVVFTTGGTSTFYLDGTAIGTFTCGTLGVSGGSNKLFNNYPGGGNGGILEYSEWGLWNTALSAGNVSSLFNGGSGGAGASPQAVAAANLKEHWRFNVSGSTIPGEVNGLTITLQGTPLPSVSSAGPIVDEPPAGASGQPMTCRLGNIPFQRRGGLFVPRGNF